MLQIVVTACEPVGAAAFRVYEGLEHGTTGMRARNNGGALQGQVIATS